MQCNVILVTLLTFGVIYFAMLPYENINFYVLFSWAELLKRWIMLSTG